MIRNGPRIRLKRAPGRRTTSMTSLPTNEVVRVQLLSSPSNSSRILLLSLPTLRRRAVDQLGEDLVERRPVLAAGQDDPALTGDLLEHPRRGGAGVLGHHQQPPRLRLPHVRHALDAPERE